MRHALRTAGWMVWLLASATGCLQVAADLPMAAAAPDERGDERRASSGAPLIAACEDGEVPRDRASACLTLAGYVREGRFGLQQDPGRAALLWESAVDILQASCSLGEVSDCTGAAAVLGMAVGRKLGGATAETAAWMVNYAEDGCRGGDADGCALLGRIYERGHGVAPDDARAAFYYDQACAGGHRQSCLFLASRAEGSDAVRAYERACRGGSGFGCVTAAQHYRTGTAVEPSVERAGALFERGCSLGDPASCVLGAEMYASGPAPDRRRALELGWAGCEQGIAGACVTLGELHERAEQPRWAREAYLRACEFGEPKACIAARKATRAERDMAGERGD
jgi:TPR repeat protein